MDRMDRALSRGGVVALVLLVGSAGLFRSYSYYGTLLRGTDGQYYYAAARSVVVSGDVDVTDDIPFSPHQGGVPDEVVPRRADGRVMNVYPVGLSLVEAAILLPAQTLAGRAAVPGYSAAEINCVAFGLLAVAALGLQALYNLVRRSASPAAAFSSVVASWLGTPLLFYTSWFPFSAHPTTFALMVALLVVAQRLPQVGSSNRLIVLFGILSAMTYLVRPHQTVYLFVLVFWRVWRVVRAPWRSWLPGAVVGLAICAAAVAFQSSVHADNLGRRVLIGHNHNDLVQTGTFDWSNPRVVDVLFSPARGVFWVTPVTLLALLGYAANRKVIPWWGWASLVNAAIQTVILSCWSDYLQGDSFGIRLWAEHAPVVACGLAALLGLGWRVRIATLLGIVLCVAWTLLLSRAYITGHLQVGMTHSQVASGAFR